MLLSKLCGWFWSISWFEIGNWKHGDCSSHAAVWHQHHPDPSPGWHQCRQAFMISIMFHNCIKRQSTAPLFKIQCVPWPYKKGIFLMILTIDTIKVISVFVPKNPFTSISKSCYLLHNGLRTGELSLTLSSSHSIFWQRDWEYLQHTPDDFEMKVAGIISTCSEYFLQHEKKSFSISDLLYGSEPLLTVAQYMEGQHLSKFIFACFLLQILNIKQRPKNISIGKIKINIFGAI